ncbi:hypothetical protein NHP164001_19980 [Helicobacter trogontum]|uniref:Uncharacterized protein n=1 Tax=Helicobacter trogontum TaxID=50960 RepID=A0ABQ0D6I5_9HELI
MQENQPLITIESKKPNDTKNKYNIKLDSHGDEIVYEARHHLTWWDYFMFSVFFPFSCMLVYTELELFRIHQHIAFIILALIFLTGPILLLHDVFYTRKNRFYITTQGIGFERRKWFRIQKKFFRFGEVGMIEYCGSHKLFYAQPVVFSLYPLQTQVLNKWYGYVIKSKVKYRVVVFMVELSILSPKLYNEITGQSFLKDFIIQKTKESCKNQNIEIKSFTHTGRFAIFGVKNEQ